MAIEDLRLEDIVIPEEPARKTALLVQGVQDVIGDKNLDSMTSLLDSRGYTLTVLKPPETTYKAILRELASIADGSNRDTGESKTLFYFTGHGDREGFGTSSWAIDPETLFNTLKDIKGNKAVILDCCHAGIFVDYLSEDPSAHLISDYVVIAACPSHAETTITFRSDEMTALTSGLMETLSDGREPVDLSSAKIKCGNFVDKIVAQLIYRIGTLIGKPIQFSFEMQRASDAPFYL